MVSQSRKNVMTVDVEDYFHVSAFDGVFNQSDWDSLPQRVEKNTRQLLNLFEEKNVKSTFFVLGWVAERFPNLIKEIVAQGHELASHGYWHKRATHMSPEEFREDVYRSQQVLQDASGVALKGYRAPSFSINETNEWAYQILKDLGFEYSSSTYPIKHDLYGVPHWPRFAYERKEGILEIPVPTVKNGNDNVGIGGGGYFRLFPYWLSKKRINKFLNQETEPYSFYFHPWEIDPEQPRVKEASAKSKIRHYINLSRMQPKLARLLDDFEWSTMEDVYLGKK